MQLCRRPFLRGYRDTGQGAEGGEDAGYQAGEAGQGQQRRPQGHHQGEYRQDQGGLSKLSADREKSQVGTVFNLACFSLC